MIAALGLLPIRQLAAEIAVGTFGTQPFPFR
jgi:hypothetical protein